MVRDAQGLSAEIFCDMKLKELLKNHVNNLPLVCHVIFCTSAASTLHYFIIYNDLSQKFKEFKNAKEFVNYIEHLAVSHILNSY